MAVTLDGTTGIGNATWTTAGRPAAPVAGQQGFNTTTTRWEAYSGTQWVTTPFVATGGTITTSGLYTIHTFTTSGTFTPNQSGTVDYLVVAGGGGAGSTTTSPVTGTTNTGGGGGGAERTGTTSGAAGGSGIVIIRYLTQGRTWHTLQNQITLRQSHK